MISRPSVVKLFYVLHYRNQMHGCMTNKRVIDMKYNRINAKIISYLIGILPNILNLFSVLYDLYKLISDE